MQPRVEERDDQGLVTRIGSLEIDWPKTLGYFGGVWLAVAYDVIAPPLGVFIAAIPLLKLLKHPDRPWPLRIVSDVLEGAAKPVGGDAETTVRSAAPARAHDQGRGSLPRRPAPRRRHRPVRRTV
jgi:hypothetical protein